VGSSGPRLDEAGRHGRLALAKQDVVEPDERRGTGAICLITQRPTDQLDDSQVWEHRCC
jgi:hypothetical protein